MHILVTGGCGFIGSHLVEYHINKGDYVHAIDDLSTGTTENVLPFTETSRFRFDQVDILTWSELERTVGWADRIYHMAAVVGVYRVMAEPIKVLATNIPGCERLLRAAAKSGWNPRIIVASSSEVYGQGQEKAFCETDDIIVESAAHSRWNYAISKVADEAFGMSYAQNAGLPITLVRFFNTVGPRQSGRYGMVLPRFIEQAVAGEPITVYGDGHQSRCFCDVRDSVVAMDRLAGNEASVHEIVNVGNDREISINALAEMVKELSGSASEIVHVPYEEAYGAKFIDIQRRKPNLDKFYRLTNYKHEWTLEQTIKDLIDKQRQKLTTKKD